MLENFGKGFGLSFGFLVGIGAGLVAADIILKYKPEKAEKETTE